MNPISRAGVKWLVRSSDWAGLPPRSGSSNLSGVYLGDQLKRWLESFSPCAPIL